MTIFPDKPKRRFLRFSLRTLLIVMLLFGVALVPFVVWLQRYREQRGVIEELLDSGASITFADGSEELSDDWWRHVVGQDLLDSVVAVDLVLTDIKSVAPLAGMKELKMLGLVFTQVSDLTPLAGLKKLQTLNLAGTPVSDLAPLALLTELQTLYLYDTQVSDLAPLAGMREMQELDLRSTPVSDLTPLVGLKKVTIWLDTSQHVAVPKELEGRVVLD